MRAVGGFLAGWLAMGLVVIAGFLLLPLLLGIERVFEPGLYQATPLWIALAMPIGLAGGCAGGWLAARIGGRGPVFALAALMLASTLLVELAREPDGPPAVRAADQSTFEALVAAREHAREPLVTRVTNPLVGLLGLGLGASLALRRSRKPAP